MNDLIIQCMLLGIVWSLLGVIPGIAVCRKIHGKGCPSLHIVGCLACAGPMAGLIALCAWIQQRKLMCIWNEKEVEDTKEELEE